MLIRYLLPPGAWGNHGFGKLDLICRSVVNHMLIFFRHVFDNLLLCSKARQVLPQPSVSTHDFTASQSSGGLRFTALTRALGPRWGLTVVILHARSGTEGVQFTAEPMHVGPHRPPWLSSFALGAVHKPVHHV